MSYEQVKKELAAGTPAELVCAACPWDRLCITPPAMTSAAVEEAIAEAKAADLARDPKGMPTGSLMTILAVGGRDSMGSLCPVFALRLRGPDGRGIADSIRHTMKHFDEDDAHA